MIYTMFAMIILTFTVAGYMFKLRVAAVKSGDVKLHTFRLNDPDKAPVKMLQTARNYSNLFEMPVLFYAAGVLAVALGLETPVMILLGWLFVLSRIIHSWIHVTSNNVIQRMQAFMAGSICVLLIWITLVWKYSVQHYY